MRRDGIDVVRNRAMGCLWGQAVGDALGLGSEFMSKADVMGNYPSGLCRYEQIVQDNHRRRWAKGAWTDDTDMMLCILNAFDGEKFDITEVARNFKAWFDGYPLGIGSHIYKVLCMADYVDIPFECSKVWWEISRKQSAANGAVMRTSVVGLLKDEVAGQAEEICRLTHYDPRCIGSCVIVSEIIHNLVWNGTQLSLDRILELAQRYDGRITEWIGRSYTNHSVLGLDLDEKKSIGYTLRTLAAALWAYWHAEDFTSGLLAIVNEGGDADTNAAVAAAILGAKFGYGSIPAYYIDNLNNQSSYKYYTDRFVEKLVKD